VLHQVVAAGVKIGGGARGVARRGLLSIPLCGFSQ
jgi:hypothetical protein